MLAPESDAPRSLTSLPTNSFNLSGFGSRMIHPPNQNKSVEVQISTQGVGGCVRLLQIRNHGVQQREINNARDTNGDGDFEISGQFLCHFEILRT
jgi:hypothetical protein